MIIDFQWNTTKYVKHEGADVEKLPSNYYTAHGQRTLKKHEMFGLCVVNLFFVTLRPTYDFFGFKTRKRAERDR